MLRKVVVIVGIILLPGIVSAQLSEIVEPMVRNNEFFVMGQMANFTPVNKFLQDQGLGFSPYGHNFMLYGVASKNKVGDRMFWGLMVGTTLEGFDILSPNILKREREKLGRENQSNKAEFSMMFTEVVVEYHFLKLGGFMLGAGAGMGWGGTKITLLGEKSGRFRISSFLISPEVIIGYHLFEGTEVGIILSLVAGYNYFPNSTWQREAGTLSYPDKFDMSGAFVSLGIGIPTTETGGK